MPRSELTPPISIEDAADLETFTAENARAMLDRLDHGALKFGAPLGWRDGTYTDMDNKNRLYRAVNHLDAVLDLYRAGSVGEDELRKRAADVANQAFMLADPLRQHIEVPDPRPGWTADPGYGGPSR